MLISFTKQNALTLFGLTREEGEEQSALRVSKNNL